MVSAEDVRELASEGRVAPHPDYHAHHHAIRFDEIVAGLRWCHRIEADHREDQDGFVAWCPYRGRTTIRVDGSVQHRPDGDLLLIFTAFEVD